MAQDKKSAPRVGLAVEITPNGVARVHVFSAANRAEGIGFYARVLPALEWLNREVQKSGE